MEIFKLFGSILVNTDEADKSLAKTDSSAKNVASSLGKGIATAGKFAAAIGTAAAGAAAGMYKMATNSASAADDIDKMSQKIGVSREAYQELSFALSQSGTDVSKLQTGLKTLSTQAEKGNAYFDKLGISLTDMNGKAKSQEELFYDVTNALQSMEEGTEKTTIATTLLGKSGTELMPLFNGTAGSLDDMRQEAHDLGLVLEDEVIDSGVNLTDTLDKMKRALGSVMTQLGARLMPIVEKASNFIIDNIPKINKLVEKIAPIFESALDKILPVIMDLAEQVLPQIIDIVTALLPPISNIFEALSPIIAELIQKLVPVVVKLVEKLLPPLIDIIDSLMPIIETLLQVLDPVFDLVLALIDPIADILKLISPIIDVLAELINDALEPIMPLISGIASLLSTVLGGAISTVSEMLSDGFIPILKGVIEFLNGDFETGITTAGEGFINVFSNALGVIDGLLGTNLQQWYAEVTAFWRDAGAKLYEVLHADELAAIEEQNTYGGIGNEVIRRSNELMRNGMSSTAALEQAKNEILDSAEKSAYFNQKFSDINDEEARRRYETLLSTGQIGSTPKLASGGVVYGKTLAVVGDNDNVKSDPEVVAPLSQLQALAVDGEQKEILREIKNTLLTILSILPSVASIDGQTLSTVIADRLNIMQYNRGGEVLY